jgi:uncharacterized protein YndB with AHSA1/START domain
MRSDFDLESRSGWTLPLFALERHDRDEPSPLAAMAAQSRSRSTRPTIVRVTKRLRASPERVFAAWIDAGTAGRWLFATASRPTGEVEIDARVGGSLRFMERGRHVATEYTGRYLQIVPPRRLVFSLSVDRGPDSTVTIEIAHRRSGCELIVSQAPVPASERERTEGRWIGMLYGLDLLLKQRNAWIARQGVKP